MGKAHTPPIFSLPATAGESYKPGELLKLSSGAVTKASGTDVATYVCACELDTAASGAKVACYRIDEETVYATSFSAAATAITVGLKVTVASDGLRVTATTASGVAEVVEMDGTASGDGCGVRFAV
jgi:hypothetical protein